MWNRSIYTVVWDEDQERKLSSYQGSWSGVGAWHQCDQPARRWYQPSLLDIKSTQQPRTNNLFQREIPPRKPMNRPEQVVQWLLPRENIYLLPNHRTASNRQADVTTGSKSMELWITEQRMVDHRPGFPQDLSLLLTSSLDTLILKAGSTTPQFPPKSNP